MKICFKRNEILDFNLDCKFQSTWKCFGKTLEKRKANFPRLYSWSSLCCHYGTSNILLNHQTFLPRNPEISVRWFLLKFVLKQMWAQGWHGKRKQMGTILLRYQPSVRCKPRTTLKSTFDFTQIVNKWKWKRGTVCHYVRFISQLSQERHMFSQWTHMQCS